MNVVYDWISALSLKQQTVILSALRGCDGKNKEDPSKTITRSFRFTILKNADGGSGFMHGIDIDKLHDKVECFIKDIDSYPMHFLLHLAHAMEIVGYKHPEEKFRKLWLSIYEKIVDAFHMNIETEEQLDNRL